MDEKKEAVQRQFGQNAVKYRDESLFAEGIDLTWMVGALQLTGTERVLDIGCGAGHTAVAFAPFTKECFGLDVTSEMVRIAAEFAETRKLGHVHFSQGDAENLPFAEESFDVVTCRFAAHHFWDIEKSVEEISRVLKPGGVFLLVDHYAPEDWELDHFVNELDRTRDPSHVREYTLSQWENYFKSHQLSFEPRKNWDLELDFANWVERAKTPVERRETLVQLLRSATSEGRETFRIKFDTDGTPISFCLKCALILGRKSSICSS